MNYSHLERVLRNDYGCILVGVQAQHELSFQDGHQLPTVTCDLSFTGPDSFDKFIKVLQSASRDANIIANNPAVRNAYEEFRMLVALADGGNDDRI